jgi:DNA-binding NarL/FixJ family response regulator
VLIADDHPLVVEGLRKLLRPDVEVVGAVGDGRAVLAAAGTLRPDVVLLDISLPGLGGLHAARQLRALVPGIRIVFLTMHADRTYAIEALAAGGSAYVVKQSSTTELRRAIHAALADRIYVSPTPLGEADPLRRPRGRRSARPTRRQRQVIELVARGRSAKEIADLLGTSVRTVEAHKGQIAAKLGLHGAADFARYAIAHGLVDA